MQKSKGFTLIELLIVVAIIAILAAIAVPNFLEAQIRAKVARVKSDHRSLATALESYYVDHGAYPPNSDGPAGYDPTAAGYLNSHGYIVMTRLSTPIAYIANALLPDPFPSRYELAGSGGAIYGYLNIQSDDFTASTVIEATSLTRAQKDQLYSLGWAMTSPGPDRITRVQEIAIETSGNPKDTDGSHFIAWIEEFGGGAPPVYDPTNGTISQGDIARTAKGILEPRHVGL